MRAVKGLPQETGAALVRGACDVYELLRLLPPRPAELERPRLDDDPLRSDELRFDERPRSLALLRSLGADSFWLAVRRRVELPISRVAEELFRPLAMRVSPCDRSFARITPGSKSEGRSFAHHIGRINLRVGVVDVHEP